MDRLDAMSILLAAVEAGSLSAAARLLGVPLSTVSRKISDLEGHLGARLLTRSSRQFELTEAGRNYVAACKRILDHVSEAERSAAGEYSAPKGKLTVTAPVVFGRIHLEPILIEFLKTYPDIDVSLVLVDRLVHMAEEHVDIAVRIGDLPDSALVATRVGAIRRIVCGSPEYFARRGRPEKPAALASHHCVSFSGLVSPEVWNFRDGKVEHAVPVNSRLVVNTAEAAIDAAVAGLGVTRVLSYQVASARRVGQLEIVLEDFELSPWPVSVVYGAPVPLPLKLRVLLDFVTPRLKAAIATS